MKKHELMVSCILSSSYQWYTVCFTSASGSRLLSDWTTFLRTHKLSMELLSLTTKKTWQLKAETSSSHRARCSLEVVSTFVTCETAYPIQEWCHWRTLKGSNIKSSQVSLGFITSKVSQYFLSIHHRVSASKLDAVITMDHPSESSCLFISSKSSKWLVSAELQQIEQYRHGSKFSC